MQSNPFAMSIHLLIHLNLKNKNHVASQNNKKNGDMNKGNIRQVWLSKRHGWDPVGQFLPWLHGQA